MKNLLTLLAFLLSFSSVGLCQQDTMGFASSEIMASKDDVVRSYKADKAFSDASELYKKLGFGAAEKLYMEKEETSFDIEQLDHLANSYRLNHKTEEAEKYYAKLVGVSTNAKYYLRYAQMLQSNNKCEDALRWFTKFKETVGEDIKHWEFQEDCAFDFQSTWHPEVGVKNYKEVNTENIDFGLVPMGTEMILTSNREVQSLSNRKDLWTAGNFTDLFQIKTKEDGLSVKPWRGKMKKKFHDGAAVFATQSEELFFTRNLKATKLSREESNLGVFRSKKENGSWSEPEAMSFNGIDYSCAHPAVRPDGKALIFASNMAGGFGGMDLYMVFKKGKSWSKPVHLGPEINSGGNELFPFWGQDNSLYFSSEGHAGMGGLDIFKIDFEKVNGDFQWTDRKHLGTPINSTMDDFSFFIKPDGKTGYFASDRPGGLGRDDVYTWTSPDGIKFFDVSNIVVRNFETKDPIKDAEIQVECLGFVEGTPTPEADIPEILLESKNLITKEEGEVAMISHPVLNYKFDIDKKDYVPFLREVPGSELLAEEKYFIDLLPWDMLATKIIVRDAVTLEPIQHAIVDVSNLGSLAEVQIDSSIPELLTNPPKMNTDESGSSIFYSHPDLKYHIDVDLDKYMPFDLDLSGSVLLDHDTYYLDLQPWASMATNVVVRNAITLEPLKNIAVDVEMIGPSEGKKVDLNAVPEIMKVPTTLNTSEEASAPFVSHKDLTYQFRINKDFYLDFNKKIDGKDFVAGEKYFINLSPDEITSLTDAGAGKLSKDLEVEAKDPSLAPTPEMLRVVPTISEIKKIKKGVVFQLKEVFYDFDKYVIREDASIDLGKLADLMNEHPSMEVQLESHTDARGKKSYNMELSRNRARSAKDFLVKNGIDASRLKMAHFGESKLTNHCGDGVICDEDLHQMNRRTEVRVLEFDGEYEIKD
ncbi:MAG: OmpA family protein [Saprospiraceae bacterium]|nr:OmpA family protein [Saprospiraceae bacterium]